MVTCRSSSGTNPRKSEPRGWNCRCEMERPPCCTVERKPCCGISRTPPRSVTVPSPFSGTPSARAAPATGRRSSSAARERVRRMVLRFRRGASRRERDRGVSCGGRTIPRNRCCCAGPSALLLLLPSRGRTPLLVARGVLEPPGCAQRLQILLLPGVLPEAPRPAPRPPPPGAPPEEPHPGEQLHLALGSGRKLLDLEGAGRRREHGLGKPVAERTGHLQHQAVGAARIERPPAAHGRARAAPGEAPGGGRRVADGLVAGAIESGGRRPRPPPGPVLPGRRRRTPPAPAAARGGAPRAPAGGGGPDGG